MKVRVKRLQNYIIFSSGQVWSKHQKRFLGYYESDGYLQVVLYENKKISFQGYLHLLIMKLFGPPKPSPKHEVNHKDGIKEHCNIENLEWTTHRENMKHASEHGLMFLPRGESNGNSRLTETDVLTIRGLWETGDFTQREIGEMYNAAQPVISRIVLRESWFHI